MMHIWGSTEPQAYHKSNGIVMFLMYVSQLYSNDESQIQDLPASVYLQCYTGHISSLSCQILVISLFDILQEKQKLYIIIWFFVSTFYESCQRSC